MFGLSRWHWLDRLMIGIAAGLVSGMTCATELPDRSDRQLPQHLPEQLNGHGGPIKAISISRDGQYALTASFDYSIIYWELSGREGKILHRMIGHDNAVNDVAFVPGTTQAVSVSDDGSLGIWELASGDLIARIPSTDHKVLDVAVSPDGTLAVAARWDGTARLYDLATQREVAILKAHRGNVNAAIFSSDGKRIYTAAHDGEIIEWDVASATMRRRIYSHGWGINALTLMDDDRLVFGALDGTMGVVSISKAQRLTELAKSNRPIQSVRTSLDGAMVGFGDGAGTIGVFLVKSGAQLEDMSVTFGPVWDFDFVPGTMHVYHVGLDDFAALRRISPRDFSQIKAELPRRFQIRDSEDPGELEFQRKCSVCHTLTPDDGNRAGPTLYNLFGRKAGTLPGYSYSAALLNTQVVWDETTVGQLFDDGPDVMLPGTKMPIQRLKSVERRDDLIRFLKQATAPPH